MTPDLYTILRQVRSTGSDGFEGLIASLLEALTGAHFNLAAAGSQHGRDMSSRRLSANVIAVECKRYRQNTDLNERELLGELVQAAQAIPNLDLWVLVASREVSSQLEESLNSLAIEMGVGFFAISSGDGSPSSLEVLCAYSPETVVIHPGVQAIAGGVDIRALLRRVAEHPHFQESVSLLRNTFSSPLAGYEAWRAQHNQWFLNTLRSDVEAQASHGQPINVEDPGVVVIRREAAWASLTEWQQGWKDTRVFHAVLGQEGDGKTWSVASWLSDRIKIAPGFPAVLFFSSTDVSSTKVGTTDLRPLFANVISRRLPRISQEQAQRRLDRWLSRPSGRFPLMLLVLDGINERRNPEWWRGLLEQLAGEPWRDQVAVLITCRSSYWEHYFSRLRNPPTTSFTLKPYNDAELNTALASHNIRREAIEDSVLPLIRKPRYFDLMVKHHERIAESGDVTVARLIYEDWRDRYERKRAITLTDDDFQNMIRQLAQSHQGTNSQFSVQEVTAALPPVSDQQPVLEELRSGGVLETARGRYKVNDRLLVYGLGLLLVDQLEQATAAGQEPREAIAGWLEPHAEMVIKAAICENASLHALSSDSLSLGAKVALLEAWVGSRNQTQSTESNLTAYLPVDPQAYVALAETVWSDAYDDRWAQELLTRSFLHWFATPRVASALQEAFERWLGYVHIHGSPIGRDSSEEAERATEEIAGRIGRTVELGPLEFAGYPLTVIDDDGKLRLGRVALAVVSHLPRNQFIRALTIGCLAEVIAGRPDKYELFAWVIRTSQQDIWPALRVEVNNLLAVDSAVTRRVARRLSCFEAGAEAQGIRETIPSDTSPPSEWYARHRKDPCTSGLAWSEEECIACLQREDLPVNWVARHIEKYSIDPNLPVPDALKARFASLTDGIDTQEMWIVLGTTGADHEFNTYEPTLAAYAPGALASLIRSVARQITERRDMAQRQLSINLVKHYLVLERDEIEAVRSAWREIVSAADGQSKEEREAEMFLFKVVLAGLDGDAQLSALLSRPETAPDLVDYKEEFLPVGDWDAVSARLTGDAKAKDLSRTLWFLSTHPSVIPHDLINNSIIPLLNHQDGLVRSLGLELTYKTKNAAAIRAVVDGGWGWDKSNAGFQNHWGSLILSEYGDSLPFDELFRRVPSSYLGYAVMRRGNRRGEVQAYGELIHQLWLRLNTNAPDLPVDLPPFNVEASVSGDVQRVSRLNLADDSSTRSIRSVNPSSTWGGMEETGDISLLDWNPRAFEEHRRQLWEIIRDAIEQQTAAGNSWFSQSFHFETLDKVINERPDLLAEWTAGAVPKDVVRRGSSFYSTLCAVLLDEQPDKGIELYLRLQEADARVRFVDHHTKIDLLDFALFDAAAGEELVGAGQRKLEECDTDLELMKITLLAQRGAGGDWLWSYIDERLHSSVPLERARAIVLLGYFDGPQPPELIRQLLRSQYDGWPKELARVAERRRARNDWAKHWFSRFLTVSDNVLAWASFRLLLQCIDTRFWFWREQVESNVGADNLSPSRRVFIDCNRDSIRNAIQANEKEMSEQFLGQKILHRHVWPWM